jgi:hypothetical protein
MAKRQKMLSLQFEDLPDEVILKSLGFLDLKELFFCGQVSKRLRSIANDESLWLKLNFCNRKVPYDFIEKAAGNGCQYLSLSFCGLLGLTGKSESPLNIKYLNLFGDKCQEMPKLVQKCSSLQKLSLKHLPLESDYIQYICQNGQTLQALDIGNCNIDCDNPKLFQDLFTNCAHLTELSISGKFRWLDLPQIQAVVDNLTPTILKVNLSHQNNLNDEHVKKLVKRCNKITHMDLSFSTLITNDSVRSIIKHLNTSLEKLDVSGINVDFAALLQLRSISTLKTLICYGCLDDEEIKNLQQQLPHIKINHETDKMLSGLIAFPCKIGVNGSPFGIDFNWIWEIRAKQQKLFATI